MTGSPALDASRATLLVLAKEPVAGRAKTRCCPPCTFEQAARLAESALVDTLTAVLATPAARRVLVLEGSPGPWLLPGFEVIAQRGGGLDVRLASAFEDVGGPSVLVGMDTPQVTPSLLSAATTTLCREGVDAVLGLADDGGYWAIGLRRADPDIFVGVPMSTDQTGRAQLARLRERGCSVEPLPMLADVDTFSVALDVAARAPGTRFAAEVARITRSLRPTLTVAGGDGESGSPPARP